MAFAADNEDRNGDCFILGTEGEPEEDIAQNHVIFCDGMPAATDATVGNAIRYTAAQVTNFVKDNTYYLYNSGIAFADALNLSYIRFLAARNGLISPEFTGNIHHVRFNDAERLPGAATVTFRNLYTNGAAGVAANEPAFTAAWNAGAAAIDKARVRRVFTDIVCCVAYISASELTTTELILTVSTKPCGPAACMLIVTCLSPGNWSRLLESTQYFRSF
jgi:hypothetical protein